MKRDAFVKLARSNISVKCLCVTMPHFLSEICRNFFIQSKMFAKYVQGNGIFLCFCFSIV